MYFCLPFIGTIFPRNKPVLISLHTYHPYFYLILLIHGFVRFIRGLNGMRLFYFFKKKKKNITLAPIRNFIWVFWEQIDGAEPSASNGAFVFKFFFPNKTQYRSTNEARI